MVAIEINSGWASTARPRWGWLFAIGAVMTAMGALASADLAVATFAATFAVGVMMVAGAILQIVHAFAVPRWSGTALWTLAGLVYLVAGLCVLIDPLFAAALLTLFLAASLALSGALRMWLALRWPAAGRGWLFVSGMVSFAAALLVGTGWPANSLWVLGLVLAVDLLVQGFTLMLAGLVLRKA